MSEIREGDLVMVVRACCAKHDMQGCIAVVREVSPNDFSDCRFCGKRSTDTLAHLTDKSPVYQWVPCSWLKKIPPLSEPETTERREEIEA